MKPWLLLSVLRPPLGLDLYMPVPEANPLSPAKIALGRRLFFDKRLSSDGTVACVSCHDPKLAFSDGHKVAVGIGGVEGTRSAPAIVDRGYGRTFFAGDSALRARIRTGVLTAPQAHFRAELAILRPMGSHIRDGK